MNGHPSNRRHRFKETTMFSPKGIRQQITDQIIESLTNGKLPRWRRSWANDPAASDVNTSLSTGNA